MIDVAVAVVAVLAGIVAWTRTEYVIHRWFMHAELGPAVASRGHLEHHRHPTHGRAGTVNFGVTSPVWDVVFRTYEPVGADEPLPARTTAF